MDANARLFRGDRIRCLPDPDWPDAPPQPIWELLCDARPAREPGLWDIHIRHVTPGTCDHSAVGDLGSMGVRMEEIEFISRAADPGTCEWCEWGVA